MHTDEPFQTTVERSAENSVEIWSASKCRISAEPEDLLVPGDPFVEPSLLDVADDVVVAVNPAGRPRANAGRRSVVNPGAKTPR
jgi:hypothetical protein